MSDSQTKLTTDKCSLTTQRNTNQAMVNNKYGSYRTISTVKRKRYDPGGRRSILKKGVFPPLQYHDHHARSSNAIWRQHL